MTHGAERTLPHDLDAERAVLGAILLHSEALDEASLVVRAEQFFRDAHRRIYAAMLAMSLRGEQIEYVSLKAELTRTGDLEEVGGPAYLTGLVDGVPRHTAVAQYARIVSDHAVRRDVIALANKALAHAYEAEDETGELLGHTEQALIDLVSGQPQANGFAAVSTLLPALLEKVEQLHQQRTLVTGIASGYTDLDEMTAGFQHEDLILIAARPSLGKTSLAVNIAEHVSQHIGPVGIFSLEMSTESLMLRQLAGLARVDGFRLRSGFLSEGDFVRIAHAFQTMGNAQLYVDDTPNLTVFEMRAKAKQLHKEHPLVLLIVDYLQLVSTPTKGKRPDTRELEVAEMARSLKSLARELHIPVIVCCQLNRGPEHRSDHRPQLSDLRECVPASATIVNPLTGQAMRVGEILDMDEAPTVLGLNSEGKLEPRSVSRIWSVGARPIFVITSATGRVLRCSAEHRLLSERGFLEAAHVTPGLLVALNRVEPQPILCRGDISVDQAVLLGWLLGDGYCGGTPTLTVCCREDVRRATALGISLFGLRPTWRPERRSDKAWKVSFTTGLMCGGTKNPLTRWLRALGVWKVTGRQKAVPRAIFSARGDVVAGLLRGLFPADGTLASGVGCQRSSPTVKFINISEQLARDVHRLLRRFGLVASIRKNRQRLSKGYGVPSGWIWTVAISSRTDVQTFLSLIGFLGWKQRRAERRVRPLRGHTVRHLDKLPMFVNEYVRALGLSYAEVGWRDQGKQMTRETAVRIGQRIGDDTLLAWGRSDVLWDRVVAVSTCPPEPCYDIEVDELHNFCCDGFITHNSGALEMHADLVLFVYRDDYYNPDSEQGGIAEIIIGKQRNGPTGVVKLAFIKEFTRFENLATGQTQREDPRLPVGDR